jgi:hypothetical protein
MTRSARATWMSALTLGVLLSLSYASAQAPAAGQAAVAAPAQCSLTWVGQEKEIEEYLRSAKVLKLEMVPIGVTKPQRAVFDSGGLVARAAWKPLPPSFKSGFHESYKAELAAYALDLLLDMHQVPPVVERKMDGRDGALIYWIENIKAWDIKKPPSGPGIRWMQQVSRMRLFDQFIGNIDRNAGNLLYDDDWHLFLIDHSRAFIDRKDLRGTTAPLRIERAFWNKIEALTLEQLQSTLGQWLSKDEIEAMLARRDRMREDIKKLAASRGETNVFF